MQGQDPWAPPDQTAPQQPGTWYAQPPWEPDPAEQRRRRRRAVAALTTVVLLLVGVLGAATIAERRREARIQAEVNALLPGLQAFVEQQRGLPFTDEVAVEVLDDGDFLDALYEAPEDAPHVPEDRDGERTLKALGLLEEDADLDEQVEEQLDAGVVGFYDPTTDRLVVRGRAADVFTELVLVHELVHALQDQHFDLDRPQLDEADDERSLAFDALVEGDAILVEEAWLASQPTDRQAEVLSRLGGEPDGQTGGDVVGLLLAFPYLSGPPYVRDVLDDGGQAALDAQFRDPPTTTEQVLRPDTAGPPVDVPRPDVEGEVVDEGVLGELGVALVVGTDPEQDGPHTAWGGDRYVTVEVDDRTCTTADIAADDPAQLPELEQALQDARPDAELERRGDVLRLTACVS